MYLMRWMAVVVLVAGMLVSLLTLTGCNTWKGMGRDVESAGEAMQGD